MKCFFGGSSMRKEYLLEQNAMLQHMLMQEQREKMALEQELRAERMKCAALEQEIAQAAQAADEMGHNLAKYFSSRGGDGASDTHLSADQLGSRQQMLGGPGGSAFGPAASMQLQCIPEHLQKQQEMLEFAEQVKDFAANLQQRLANASANTTPRGADAAAAAAAGPFGSASAQHQPPPGPGPMAAGLNSSAAFGGGAGVGAGPSSSSCRSHHGAGAAPSRPHSSAHTSAPSEHPGSMDLPMQALAVSRLALQLHQPQGLEEETSCFSSSGRKSSCTVLGGSVDLTSSIGSLASYLHSHQSATTAGLGGAFEQLLGAAAEGGSAHNRPLRNAAMRASVTRGAAAVASSCASIAAAAAATAAAAAAKKAAAAAAMADASQAHADLRASTESGFSIRSSDSLSATLRQRKQWQQAHEQWDAHHRQQQQQQRHQQQHNIAAVQRQQQQHDSKGPVPVELPGKDEGCSELSSAQSSPVGGAEQERPGTTSSVLHWTNPTFEEAASGLCDLTEEESSCSRPTSTEPAAEGGGAGGGGAAAAGGDASSASQGGQPPKLPAVPAFLGASGFSQRVQQQEQQQRQQPQQRFFRYGSDKLSAALTSPTADTFTGSTGAHTMSSGASSTAALPAARPSPAASFSSKPPPHLPRPQAVGTPQLKQGAAAASGGGVGPLHRSLSSLCSSSSSFRLSGAASSVTHQGNPSMMMRDDSSTMPSAS